MEPAPHVHVDIAIVERSASIGCTMEEIAALCGVSVTKVFTDRARYPEIGEAYDRGRAMGRATLRRMQWQEAQKGNPTMLIWLGKQLLGQKDRQELTGEDGRELFPAITVMFGDDTARLTDGTNGIRDKPGQYGPS